MTAADLTSEQMRDLAGKTRDLADDYEEAGYVELPDWLRALAAIADGDCPMHGREMPVVPVDGHEVDQAPEREEDMPGHECCPDCGDDPNDHTSHADGCRRIGTAVEIQCGPPWNPFPEAGDRTTNDGSTEPARLSPSPLAAQQIRKDEDARSATSSPHAEKES